MTDTTHTQPVTDDASATLGTRKAMTFNTFPVKRKAANLAIAFFDLLDYKQNYQNIYLSSHLNGSISIENHLACFAHMCDICGIRVT